MKTKTVKFKHGTLELHAENPNKERTTTMTGVKLRRMGGNKANAKVGHTYKRGSTRTIFYAIGTNIVICISIKLILQLFYQIFFNNLPDTAL